jgi:very-short-patch-repair endonuclease
MTQRPFRGLGFVRYNPVLTARARRLRNNSTLSEVLLWKELKGKQMMGYDFHRQKPIDQYIVDFFCPKLMLAIEIDGTSHIGKAEKDKKRQNKLENLGIKFLRFGDLDVKRDKEGVLRAIKRWIEMHEERINSAVENRCTPGTV